jgi:16S rRNA (cytosine1402-N4)-methyltransferase
MPEPREAVDNPRARSAVLRVAERTQAPLPADQGASFVKAMKLVPLATGFVAEPD